MGKITLNAYFFDKMEFKLATKKSIQFGAIISVEEASVDPGQTLSTLSLQHIYHKSSLFSSLMQHTLYHTL